MHLITRFFDVRYWPGLFGHQAGFIGAILGSVASTVVGGLLSDSDSGGGGGGGGGSGVSPGQNALAQTQSDFQQYLMSRMKDKFAPLEDQFIADASKAGTPDEIASKMGAAHGTAAQTQAAAERSTAEMLRRRGVSMTSPAALALQQDAALAGAANDGAVQTAARDAEINRGLALKQAAIGIGRGLDSTAATLGNSASNILSAGANQANAAWARQRQANMDTGYAVAPIAKAVGRGVSGWIKNNTGVGGYSYGAVDGGSGGYGGSQWSDGDDGGIYGANYDSLAGWGADGGVINMARKGVPRYSSGGIVEGPGGPTDDAVPAVVDGQKPIAVSDGEAVINTKATNDVLGSRLVHIINALGVLRRTVEGEPSAQMAGA